MASLAFPSASSASPVPFRAAQYPDSTPTPKSLGPPGTFQPGTKVQVGSHRVTIEKYLSEGGFAHVYVVRVPRPGNKHEIAVLKRVAVPDREQLADMRNEVETMKKLKGHSRIVTYMDSHANAIAGREGYEVFLLMEYCNGGGLIDFMNTRLQHRLTEPEILKIFADVAEGVACMHYLRPPLLHRDLKVENVLISKAAGGTSTPTYKLCDFGSAARPRAAAKTADEGRLIEEDVQKHTTLQYRSPEMVDVWRKQPIDEKADIWALGVLLYKLCYYTTPFEEVGQMAILNATFKYPSYPPFSDRLKKLVGVMLREDPKNRPNIYQVLKEVCSIRGTQVPIKDIYATRTPSDARRNESLPDSEPNVASRPPAVGLVRAAPTSKVEAIPDIVPQRRGRLTAPAQKAPVAAKASASPSRGDPFAALDSKSFDVRRQAVDDLSSRYPSLDEFAIAHDGGGKYKFPEPGTAKKADVNKRLTNALADDVFASVLSKDILPPRTTSLPHATSPQKPKTARSTRNQTSQQSLQVHQPTPLRPGYTSTGTMTSPSPSPPPARQTLAKVDKRPVWRVPDDHRASSQPRPSESAQAAADFLQPSLPPAHRPAMFDSHRSKPQTAASGLAAQSPQSSRPSLEGHRPSNLDINDTVVRTKSAQARQRPSSVFVTSNLDYLRDQETTRKRPSVEIRRRSRQRSANKDTNEEAADERHIDNDTDFLRSVESNNDSSVKRKGSRQSSGHKKRSSLPSLSLSATKSMLAGRFGDAFKKFEHSPGDEKHTADEAVRTPSPRSDAGEVEDGRLLSPIQGSEATPSRHSDPDGAIEETEDLPPDVKRELERRRLSQEERRVAEAAAEYRSRVAGNDTGGSAGLGRSNAIQQRAQAYMLEGRQSPALRKTAEGYERFTELETLPSQQRSRPSADIKRTVPPQQSAAQPAADFDRTAPLPTRESAADAAGSGTPYQKPRQQLQAPSDHPPGGPSAPTPTPSASAPPAQYSPRVVSRPSAPPKPKALRTGPPGQWPPAQSSSQSSQSFQTGQQQRPQTDKALPERSGLAALLARDLEGVPEYPPRPGRAGEVPEYSARLARADRATAPSYPPRPPSPTVNAESDLEAEFSQKFPRLSGLEMVEAEMGGAGGGGSAARRGMRIREV